MIWRLRRRVTWLLDHIEQMLAGEDANDFAEGVDLDGWPI